MNDPLPKRQLIAPKLQLLALNLLSRLFGQAVQLARRDCRHSRSPLAQDRKPIHHRLLHRVGHLGDAAEIQLCGWNRRLVFAFLHHFILTEPNCSFFEFLPEAKD